MEDLKLPNIFEVKVKRNKWKTLVKNAILAANEKELKDEIKESKKLKNSELANEKFGIKKYVFELSLHESRTLFKHRTKVTQHVKMNFRNDKLYAKKLWKCECGNMDTESHLLWCEEYSKLRENLDFSKNKDLCKYLQKILDIRSNSQ